MMISPDMFVDRYRFMKYKELLPVRDELIKSIREFETKTYDPEMDRFFPSPEVQYQMHLEYLGKLCLLISEKYNEEIVRGIEEE